MSRSTRLFFSMLAGACQLFVLSSLQANAQEVEFNEGSQGGVEIKFRNGCWISYDRYAKRGGNAGYCSPPQYQQADAAALEYLNTSGSSHDSPVAQSQMERYCQGEASAELGTRPNNIATYGLDKRGSDFVVSGQSPESGYNVTTFECVYGKRGMWKGIHVTGRGQDGGNDNGGNQRNTIPQSAKDRCLDMFADQAEVTNISALRPGYWEVIMQSQVSARSVACTISDDGDIQEWTELD